MIRWRPAGVRFARGALAQIARQSSDTTASSSSPWHSHRMVTSSMARTTGLRWSTRRWPDAPHEVLDLRRIEVDAPYRKHRLRNGLVAIPADRGCYASRQGRLAPGADLTAATHELS